jgi:hypothetical protein
VVVGLIGEAARQDPVHRRRSGEGEVSAEEVARSDASMRAVGRAARTSPGPSRTGVRAASSAGSRPGRPVPPAADAATGAGRPTGADTTAGADAPGVAVRFGCAGAGDPVRAGPADSGQAVPGGIGAAPDRRPAHRRRRARVCRVHPSGAGAETPCRVTERAPAHGPPGDDSVGTWVTAPAGGPMGGTPVGGDAAGIAPDD